ncbi:MAG: nitroreductase family protein [Candidatus Aenigmatarchaeota archaeon]
MIDAIRKRRSCRSFADREVETEKLEEILKAASFAPSAHGRYPWELIVVKDDETREELSKTSPWAKFIAESPAVVVVIGDEENSSYWIEDCSVLAENIQLEAANQGLGSCWAQARNIESPGGKDTEEEVREVLELPEDRRILCMIAIGYPNRKKSPHSDGDYKKERISFID